MAGTRWRCFRSMWETSGRGGAAGVLREEERRSGPIRYSRLGIVMNVLGETSAVLVRRGRPAVLPRPESGRRPRSIGSGPDGTKGAFVGERNDFEFPSGTGACAAWAYRPGAARSRPGPCV